MRIGVFGGTFDPPHVGHLLAASDALDALALERVVFVPACDQPLKVGTIVASARDRLAMVSLMVGDDPRFAVDEIEVQRGGLSFTVDTLRAFRERWWADRDLALFLLLGQDAMDSLPKWRESAEIAALARIVVLTRDTLGDTRGDARSETPFGEPSFVKTRRLDVSSTEVRKRVASGKSIHGFVADAVMAYVTDRRLYL